MLISETIKKSNRRKPTERRSTRLPFSVSSVLSFTDVGQYKITDTYSYANTSTDTFTNYQAGCYANGSYAFTSVVFLAAGTTTDTTVHEYESSTDTVSASSNETVNETFSGSATFASGFYPGQLSGSGTHYATTSDASSYTSTDSATFDAGGTDTFSSYAAGSFANETYGFASYVYQAGGQGTYTMNVFHGQGGGQTMNDTASDSANYQLSSASFSSVDNYSSSGSDSANLTSQETYTEKLTGAGNYNLYEAGTYGQSSFSLASVTFNEQGTWTANSTYQFSQSQGGSTSNSWSASGQETYTGGGGTQTGSYNDSGSSSENFSAGVTLTYGQHATNCFTSYQAGSWANGSYSYGSLTYDGSGNESFTTTSAETWSDSGGGNVTDSSTGISTAGIQGSYAYGFSSSYTFNGSGSGLGNYSLHEEGSYSAGSYNLTAMSHSVGGSMVLSDSFSGNDSSSASGTFTNFNYFDSYNGGAAGQTSYSLSDSGRYSNHSWAITRFTESESTYANSSYGASGSYMDATGAGSWQFSAKAGSTFTLYGVGSYSNGCFSFLTFSSTLSATIYSDAQGQGHNSAWSSYSYENSTSHSAVLKELGQGQTGNYTLTLDDSVYRTFTGVTAGHTVTMTSSNDVSTTATGIFSLTGGNPYLPMFVSGMAQAAIYGVGLAVPWWSGGGGPNNQAGQGNRITVTLPRIDPSRLLPDWSLLPPGGYGPGAGGTSGGSGASGGSHAPGTGIDPHGPNASTVPGQNVGVPPASSDEPNLGLPAGPNGPIGGINTDGFSYGPAYSNGSSLLPPFESPQQSPNNGPYDYSYKRTMGTTDKVSGDCFCGTGMEVTIAFINVNGNRVAVTAPYMVGDGEMPVFLGDFSGLPPPSPPEKEYSLSEGRGGVQPQGDAVNDYERTRYTGGPLKLGSMRDRVSGGNAFEGFGDVHNALTVDFPNTQLNLIRDVGPVFGPLGVVAAGTINAGSKDWGGLAGNGAELLGMGVLGVALSRGAKPPVHHIATNKHPSFWTPKFKKLFARGGLTLGSRYNKVPVRGHVGPHPWEYHQFVFDRLFGKLEGVVGKKECRRVIIEELRYLRSQILKPGSRLNQMVTRMGLWGS